MSHIYAALFANDREGIVRPAHGSRTNPKLPPQPAPDNDRDNKFLPTSSAQPPPPWRGFREGVCFFISANAASDDGSHFSGSRRCCWLLQYDTIRVENPPPGSASDTGCGTGMEKNVSPDDSVSESITECVKKGVRKACYRFVASSPKALTAFHGVECRGRKMYEIGRQWEG